MTVFRVLKTPTRAEIVAPGSNVNENFFAILILGQTPRVFERRRSRTSGAEGILNPRGLIKLRNAGCEPAPGGVADKEHRVIAGVRWRRREHIVDPEVSVRLKRDST